MSMSVLDFNKGTVEHPYDDDNDDGDRCVGGRSDLRSAQ